MLVIDSHIHLTVGKQMTDFKLNCSCYIAILETIRVQIKLLVLDAILEPI